MTQQHTQLLRTNDTMLCAQDGWPIAVFICDDHDKNIENCIAAQRAINCHDDLLAALERMQTQMRNILLIAEIPKRFAESFNESQRQADEALAKARGQQ